MFKHFKDKFPRRKRKLTLLMKELLRDTHSVADVNSQIEIETLHSIRKKVRKLDPALLVEDLLKKLHMDFESQPRSFDEKSKKKSKKVVLDFLLANCSFVAKYF